ncbi:MAG: galactose mutarotase [Clostridiales bacterium]|nr:galactose mutarotase [Clostridiales bacterium]
MITKTYSFTKEGKINDVYTLKNAQGVEVDILTYGARILRVFVPDKKGKFADIIVGCKKPEDYYEPNPCFGGTVGRFANRIGGASFVLNGERYILEQNDGKNCLHGGKTAAFATQIWQAEIVKDSLVLTQFSPDGAGGFPGNLTLTLTVTLSDENELRLDYQATTDKDTVCNFTNHAYFNLGYQPTVLSHELSIAASKITKVDDELIPHGEYIDVTGTPYDFRHAKPIGQDIFANEPMLRKANGYDFNYCLDRVGKGLEHFGYVYDQESGRRMDCYTTLPAVQLYTACKTGSFAGRGKKRAPYENYCALCLETQGYPNSPNVPTFPSCVLKAGETYREITAYRFSVK